MTESLSDEEVRLLQSLEDEGLLSRNVVWRVRSALHVATVARQKRNHRAGVVVFILAQCGLMSAATASPWLWLTVLCGALCAACFVFTVWCARGL